jgi:hypothetical protein
MMKRSPPEPGDALGYICSQARRRWSPFLLECRPHEQERYERHGIRHCVGREWQQPADPEERSAQGLAHEIGPLHACLVLGDGSRQLLLRNDLGQRGGFRQAEEDEERAFDERDDHDLRERERSEGEDEREASERERATSVGYEHDPLAVPAIDEGARGQVEDHVREGLREADDPGLRRRVRERKDEQGIGDARDARADRRDDLPAPEQDEVPVPPEWRRR